MSRGLVCVSSCLFEFNALPATKAIYVCVRRYITKCCVLKWGCVCVHVELLAHVFIEASYNLLITGLCLQQFKGVR